MVQSRFGVRLVDLALTGGTTPGRDDDPPIDEAFGHLDRDVQKTPGLPRRSMTSDRIPWRRSAAMARSSSSVEFFWNPMSWT